LGSLTGAVAICRYAAFVLIVLAAQPAQAELQLWTVDGEGTARSAASSGASLQRTPPKALPADPLDNDGDPDALRYLLVAPVDELPSLVDLVSLSEDGAAVAVLRGTALQTIPCPAAVRAASEVKRNGAKCAVTQPIRCVADDIDGGHPLVRSRSIRAVLGGAIAIARPGGARIGAVRVMGPRWTSAGRIERLRAKLRFVLVRLAPNGTLPVGGDASGALRIAGKALGRVNALWGSCGLGFGNEPVIEMVDPPPPHLLAVGCGHGFPASGGTIAFSAAGREIEVTIDAGYSPAEAARRVARVLDERGFITSVSDNPRMAAGAGASTDISVRDRRGRLVALKRLPRRAVSSDATLTACIGGVNLEDGLQHFGDVNAMVGTIEERTLIKAFDDHDPTTIDVMLVPGFARGGRIGESFIGQDGGAIRNVVVIDRAGIRSNQASFTLAHEVGHVLLDDPGHPDDFGVDLPSRLMDADAADSSAFGPRRLVREECARALRQSGPNSAARLLEAWPLSPTK
jgi:hypothetical protein